MAKKKFDILGYLNKKIAENPLPPIDYEESDYLPGIPRIPDGCPSFSVWDAAYGKDPIESVRKVLEEHVAECEFCKELHLSQKELAEKIGRGEI